MPLLPVSLIEPLWVEFSARLGVGDRPEFDPGHPWGCHRRRVPERVVFEHALAALVHGSGYERIATPGCSDRTIRRRLAEWAERGVGIELLESALIAYDTMIGLDLEHLSVDGAITKSPCGGEFSGRSPVDRGKQRLKRSVACDGTGIPLAMVSAGANRTTRRCSNPPCGRYRRCSGRCPSTRVCTSTAATTGGELAKLDTDGYRPLRTPGDRAGGSLP